MMEAARTSETLIKVYQTTRCYNPEDSHFRAHSRENLKSYSWNKNRLLNPSLVDSLFNDCLPTSAVNMTPKLSHFILYLFIRHELRGIFYNLSFLWSFEWYTVVLFFTYKTNVFFSIIETFVIFVKISFFINIIIIIAQAIKSWSFFRCVGWFCHSPC
jgi:hypothetical protein